jgi:hypothetical protein
VAPVVFVLGFTMAVVAGVAAVQTTVALVKRALVVVLEVTPVMAAMEVDLLVAAKQMLPPALAVAVEGVGFIPT